MEEAVPPHTLRQVSRRFQTEPRTPESIGEWAGARTVLDCKASK